MHLRHRARPRDGDGDDGFTLIELLAAVSIMGVSVVAILGALGVMITASRQHRQMANANIVLASAAEVVKAAPYVPCTSATVAATYAALALPTAAVPNVTRPSDWGSAGRVDVVAVDHWTGTDFAAGVCATDLGLERVTLRVTSPDGATADSLTFVKSGLASLSGGVSPCDLKNPSVTASPQQSTQDVRPNTLEDFKLHLDPGSCGVDLPALYLYIPGLALTAATEVPNPASGDPTWEIDDLRMPPATTAGWGTPGALLTAILYDENGLEAGRFYLRVL